MKPEAHFQVYKDSAGEWRWRLRGGNNEIMAVSEAFTEKGSAKRAVLDTVEAVFAVANLQFSHQEDQEILEAIHVIE